MTKKLLSTLLCALLVLSSVVMASAATTSKSSTGDTKYSTASDAIDAEYGYDGKDLGANYSPESTTFKVWAPTATSIQLNLFATGSDYEDGAKNLGTYNLEKLFNGDKFTGIWTYKVDGDIKNVYYTYTIAAKNVTGEKSTTKETADVYSVATGVNGKRSMVCDLSDTNPDNWDNDVHVLPERSTKSSVWEVHVKDFSYNTNSGVSEAHRGKYLGFTETGTTLNNKGKISTCIDYLKELGITTVQINPFYDYGSVDESGGDTQFNWGYDPVNYNVPEGSYSTNPYDGNVRIKECKQMIQALHNAGISVVMDVVYNHTYSADSCFERTVPNYYYRMKADGGYSNGSGCGNETASEKKMYRNYMLQSCAYWVNEYHIDGFRFDLMALHDTETMNLIREELDSIDPRITMWGEGWSGGSSVTPSKTCTGTPFKPASQSNSSGLSERIAFFNDQVRDGLKGSVFGKTGQGWIQGVEASYQSVVYGTLANTKSGKWSAKQPSQCVTYDSCHDNQTLWDRLCASQNLTDYFRKRHPLLVAENKVTGGMLSMSQGITFMLAGEEMGRSKDNDENSYASSPKLNMLDWEQASSNADIVSYYKGMLKIRKSFSPLTDDTNSSASNFLLYTGAKNPSSVYAGVWKNNTEGEWKNLAVLANTGKTDVEYTLEENTGINEWVIIANDQYAGTRKIAENGKTFKIPAKSMIIAVDKESFNSADIKSDQGVVTVKHINSITGELIEQSAVTGTIGTRYSLPVPLSISKELELNEIDGEMEGVFTDGEQNVIASYGYYVPESAKVDINGDSKSNINDATYMQKALAKIVTFTDEQTKLADINYDGEFDINDVAMYQKALAKMNVSTGKIVVNFLNKDTNEKVKESVEYSGRVGEDYKVPKSSFIGYNYDNTQELPDYVKVPLGVKEINVLFTETTPIFNIHVKHSGTKSWTPYIWVWGTKNGEYKRDYCKEWPGDALTEKDEKGWATESITANPNDDAYSFLISDNSDPQSEDFAGFIQSDIWVVIDDSKPGVNLIVYDENPDDNPNASPIKSA